ncbi:tetratricopeptide repeat protein [Methanoplanus endosymbiosus]|uniref:Tetratricopeptide repeat protein n=1 Tax=Methanoplanus endosymbiosus TaxID=33865 RepID=A0A9E7PM08_9EURY|nr:tetratricopeptide repeat protein [Methanoplanus endosymbiosus]UUX91419.1 tetratricopeptide repeat protein [Methanoplanus endosymbiosus]
MKITYLKLMIIAMAGILIIAAQPVSAGDMNKIEYYNLAVDYANEGNFDEALSAADSAIAIDENFTLAYTTKAGVLNAMGRYDEALESAKKATEIRPDQPEGWVNMASSLIGLERYEEAVEASDMAIETDPECIEGYITKGTALGELGRYDEEIAVSEKALEISPGDSRAVANKRYAEDMAEGGNNSEKSPLPLPFVITGVITAGILYYHSKK